MASLSFALRTIVSPPSLQATATPCVLCVWTMHLASFRCEELGGWVVGGWVVGGWVGGWVDEEPGSVFHTERKKDVPRRGWPSG